MGIAGLSQQVSRKVISLAKMLGKWNNRALFYKCSEETEGLLVKLENKSTDKTKSLEGSQCNTAGGKKKRKSKEQGEKGSPSYPIAFT